MKKKLFFTSKMGGQRPVAQSATANIHTYINYFRSLFSLGAFVHSVVARARRSTFYLITRVMAVR